MTPTSKPELCEPSNLPPYVNARLAHEVGSQRNPASCSGESLAAPSAPQASATNASFGLLGYHAGRVEYVNAPTVNSSSP